MSWHSTKLGLAVIAAVFLSVPHAVAQPADLSIPPATTTQYPVGISVAKIGASSVYVDSSGRTLYGLDLRTVHRSTPSVTMYCKDRCAEWEPLLPPPGTRVTVAVPRTATFFGQVLTGPAVAAGLVTPQQAPDWGVMEGPAGPQYVYKGWHMVYVRKGDKPRSVQFDGADDMTWNTLKFVPPVPKMPAPTGVVPVYRDGAYALANKDGRLLYTGRCSKDCAAWRPLGAGLLNQGVGEWTVSRTADNPQWLYRGKPVFVSADADMASLPKAAVVLRP